uniref:uncharacterized protein LOC143404534 n=1 Tax=Callospermophilus lateralis TaxID=76772 RepID=UPI00403861C8
MLTIALADLRGPGGKPSQPFRSADGRAGCVSAPHTVSRGRPSSSRCCAPRHQSGLPARGQDKWKFFLPRLQRVGQPETCAPTNGPSLRGQRCVHPARPPALCPGSGFSRPAPGGHGRRGPTAGGSSPACQVGRWAHFLGGGNRDSVSCPRPVNFDNPTWRAESSWFVRGSPAVDGEVTCSKSHSKTNGSPRTGPRARRARTCGWAASSWPPVASPASAPEHHSPAAPFQPHRGPCCLWGRPGHPLSLALACPFCKRQTSFLSCGCPSPGCPVVPTVSPIKPKCLGLFSEVPLTSQPRLSPFPNTRSAPAKLIRLLSPCPRRHTGHFSLSGSAFPSLSCTVHFGKTQIKPAFSWA